MENLHSLVIAARVIVGAQHVFGIIVPNIQKPPVCTLLRFSGAKFLRHLNVQLVFPLCGDEIDFAMLQLSRGYGISPPEQFQINRIFQHGENAVGRITQHAVTQSGIGKVEFFLRF